MMKLRVIPDMKRGRMCVRLKGKERATHYDFPFLETGALRRDIAEDSALLPINPCRVNPQPPDLPRNPV